MEQLRPLARGALVIAFNPVNAAVAAAVLWSWIPGTLLLAWVAATALIAALRIRLLREFRRNPGGRSAAAWARLFTLGAALSGALWGALGLSSLLLGSLVSDVFIAFIIGGMTAGALGLLSPYLPAYVAYLVMAAGPLAAALPLQPGRAYLGMGALVCFYIAVMSLIACGYNRRIVSGIRLRLENLALNGELTEARDTVRRAARDKWETLAHLAHELRTPMNAVLGFAEMLERQPFGPLGDRRYVDYARYVQDSGRHILDLVNEILAIAEAEAGEVVLALAEVEIDRTARECVSILSGQAAASGVDLTAALPEDLPRLRADPLKLRQILLNLLSNGIKYTPAGGSVALTSRALGADAVEITVSDTGSGMAPEDIPKAMQPFVRLGDALARGTQGTGLGLPLTNRLVTLHGGRMAISSERGRGTRITVTLPVRGPPATPPGA